MRTTFKYLSAVSLLAAAAVSLPMSASAGCATLRPTCSTYSYPPATRHYSAPVTRSYRHHGWSSSRPVHRAFETAPCPPNTSPQPDGTCLIRGYSTGLYGTTRSHHSYTSSYLPAYSYGSSAYSGSSYYGSGTYGHTEYLPCPAGTVQQPDRSCLVAGGVLRTPGYGTSYGSPHAGTYSWTGYGEAVPVTGQATPIYAAPATRSAPEVVIYTGGATSPAAYQPVALPYPTYR